MTTTTSRAEKNFGKLPKDRGRNDELEPLRVLNVRVLVITLLVLVVTIPLAILWHSYVMGYNVETFVTRAEQLAQEGEYGKASSYLTRYLRLHPEDDEKFVLRAKLYDKAAKENAGRKRQAISYYYEAIGRASGDLEMRARLAELLLEFAQFSRSKEQANILLSLTKDKTDSHQEQEAERLEYRAQGLKYLALSSFMLLERNLKGSGTLDEITQMFVEARKALPADTQLAASLATIYRERLKKPDQLQRNQLADEVMDSLIEADPENPEAYLSRYQYRKRFKLSDAEDDITRAVKLGANKFNILISAGDFSLAKAAAAQQKRRWTESANYFNEAEEFFQKAIRVKPNHQLGHVGLGATYLTQGKAGLAIDTWREGLEKVKLDTVELNARITSTLLDLDRLEEAAVTLEALQTKIDQISPQLDTYDRNSSRTAINFLRAKWLVKKQQYRNAIPILRSVIVTQQGLTNNPRTNAERFQARLLLGKSYAAVGEWDQAATEYEEAVTLSKGNTLAIRLLADAQNKSGRTEQSHRLLSEILQREESAPGVWLSTARTLLQDIVSYPTEQRDWQKLDKLLNYPPGPLRTSWQLRLLEADVLIAKGEKNARIEALEALERAEKSHPKSAELYQKLVLIYERLNKPEEANRALSHFKSLDTKSVAPLVVEAELYVVRRKPDQARELLLNALEEKDGGQQDVLRYALFRLNMQTGRIAEAKKELYTLHKKFPENTSIINELAELAFDARNFNDVERWENVLKKNDGEESTQWQYYKARRLLAQVEGMEDPQFFEAVKLQQNIEKWRPGWPAGHLLKGLITEIENKPSEAIDAYEKAILLGETRVGVYRRLILLLYRSNRLSEAHKYFNRLHESIAYSPGLRSVGVEIFKGMGNISEAIRIAKLAVEVQPKDPIAWLHLGQVYLYDKQDDRAEKAFRKSVELAPKNARSWNGLITFYLTTGQKEAAAKIFENLPQLEDVSQADQEFIKAQGYELIGKRKEAEKHFSKARELAPKDVAILMRMATFMVPKDPTRAEQLLRDLLEIDPDNGNARRLLASILYAQGGSEQWEESQQLLSKETPEENLLNERLTASLLVRRGGADNRKRARQILEKLTKNPKTTFKRDQLLLIKLYEAEGQISLAQQQFVKLVIHEQPNPQHIAMFIDFLLRHEKTGEASRWMRRLTSIQPDNWQTMFLRARLMKQDRRENQIEARLEKFGKDQIQVLKEKYEDDVPTKEIVQLCSNMGKIYTSVELHRQAEIWYDRLKRADPELFQPLANAYAAQGKYDETIKLCLNQAEKVGFDKAILVLSMVLSNDSVTEEHFVQIESVLESTLHDFPDKASVIFSVAYLRSLQDRYEESSELYKKILDKNPDHILSLNNIAAVLSEIPGRHEEGLKYINRAIDLRGPQPPLLDTKAMLLLEQNPSEAVRLLEDATAISNPDPRFYFHLAAAYQKIGNLEGARSALKEAKDHQLDKYPLTRQDQVLMKNLQSIL